MTMTFDDPGAAAGYGARTLRLVPGLDVLHRLTGQCLAEAAPATARILVVGAGGGLELKALAGQGSGWRFHGVDPSAAMLDAARSLLDHDALARTTLTRGTIDDVDAASFDGACCLLVLHFLNAPERLRTLRAIRQRLLPGARLVVAHHSVADGEAGDRMLARFAACSAGTREMPSSPADSVAMMRANLALMSPREDAELLRSAGFRDIDEIFCAFSIRGWVARA